MAEMHDVRFRFSSVATGISPLEEKSPSVNTFEVYEVIGREAISDLYSFEIQLFSEDPYIDGSKLINKRATLEIDLDSDIAPYQGIVASFDEESRGHYRAVLVPLLWTAGLTRQSQIFLDKDLKTIVTDVLKENGLKEDDDFSIVLKGKHRVRDYTVQYEESDLNFIRRLMEHAGVYFWFEHGEKKEKLIIRDLKSQHSLFREAPANEVSLRGPGFVADEEIVGSIRVHHRVLPQKVILKDYNYRKPTVEMKATADAMKTGTGFLMEYGNHFKTPEEGTELATIRAQEITCRETTYIGASGCRRFHPGFIFTLLDDLKIWREEVLDLLLVSVEHHGKQDWVSSEGALPTRARTTYNNTFEAIKSEIQFRPERKTPRPRLSGVMHANIDAGGSGQYAEIDDQGRYKVKLPFDLSDAAAGKASHAIRMAQPYAGASYGTHFPLHKGIEVLLTHVDGDLDRPVIDGAVPNPVTGSAVTGPNQTQSVIRTAGQNEVVMEDLAGAEQIKLFSPFDNSKILIGAPDSTDGIRLTTDGHGVFHAKKGLYLNAWPTDYWNTGSASQIINGAIAATGAVGGMAAAAGGGKLAFLAALAGVAGAVANVAAPGIVVTSPAGISAMTPSTFTGVGLAGVGLLTPAMANIVGVAGAAVMSGGGVQLYTIGGGIRIVASFGVIKINARSSNISAIAKKNVVLEAQTADINGKAKKNIILTALTDDIKLTAKKNFLVKAETDNVNINAKKTMVLRADENLVASAKQQVQIIAEDGDFNIGAGTTKLILKAKQEMILECGDSKITLLANGEIRLVGKKVILEAEKGGLRLDNVGFTLEGDEGHVASKNLKAEANGGTHTIKGDLVKIN